MKDFREKFNLKEFLFLGLLVIVGLIVFFHKLDSIPPGFYVDEALHGYNAYSILQTGKDEYGKLLPLVFRFYGSYNAPLYVYLTTIPIRIFGLSIFSVRFLAAFSGFISVFVLYFFLKSLKINTLGALFFALTPWLIFQSRIGYEVSLAFFLFSLGSLFLWLSLENKNYIIPAFLSLSLSTYAAYTERFVVPALLVLFFVFFRGKILRKENFRILKFSLILLFLTQIPNLMILSTPAFFPKSDLIGSATIESQAEKLMGIFPGLLAIFFSFAREFLSQYVNYFSPRSLFLVSGGDAPELSVFYPWMIAPFLFGAFYLWKNRDKDAAKFIGLLLLLTPIPAALTKDPFSTHRAMPLVLPITLVISQGLDRLITFHFTKFSRLESFLKGLVVFAVFIFSMIFLWRSYFVFFPYEKAKEWQFGYRQLVSKIVSRPNEHFVIDQTRLALPYIELAFFLKFPPLEFQKSVDQSIKDNYYGNLPYNPYYQFDNLETRPIIWEKDVYKNQVLVGDEYSISFQQAEEHFLTKIFEIRDPLDQIVFQGFQTNPKLKCKVSYVDLYCSKYK